LVRLTIRRKLALAALLPCVASTISRGASAEPAGVEVAARTGLAYGLGARAGASIASLYFGVSLIEYFWGSQTTLPPPGSGLAGSTLGDPSTGAKVTEHALLYGIALGYDLKPLKWLTIRPEVGAGFFTETTTRTCAPDCASTDKQTNAYIEPGVTGLVGLGPYLFAGADADLILVPSGMALVSALHGQFGIRF
jgi:hypothetical protein